MSKTIYVTPRSTNRSSGIVTDSVTASTLTATSSVRTDSIQPRVSASTNLAITTTGSINLSGSRINFAGGTAGFLINDGSTTQIGGSGNVVMRVIGATQRVGINNASPASTLDVTGTCAISGNMNVDSGTLFVDSANNRVGINTTSPTQALDVNGSMNVSGNVSLSSGSTIFSTQIPIQIGFPCTQSTGSISSLFGPFIRSGSWTQVGATAGLNNFFTLNVTNVIASGTENYSVNLFVFIKSTTIGTTGMAQYSINKVSGTSAFNSLTTVSSNWKGQNFTIGAGTGDEIIFTITPSGWISWLAMGAC